MSKVDKIDRDNDLVCLKCGARFPMPGPIYEGWVIEQDGYHEVKYYWPPRTERAKERWRS